MPTGSAIASCAVPPLTVTGLPKSEPLTRNWTEPSGGRPAEDDVTTAVKVADWPDGTEDELGERLVFVAAGPTVSVAAVSAAGKVAA